MVEAAATCRRNIYFLKLKSLSTVTPRLPTVSIMFDAMIRDGCREETSKFAALSLYTYNDEICFVSIEPEISLRYAVTKLLKRKI